VVPNVSLTRRCQDVDGLKPKAHLPGLQVLQFAFAVGADQRKPSKHAAVLGDAMNLFPAMLRRLPPFTSIFVVAVCTLCAQAATVNVVVTDPAARPLADAVVMLEPTSGHLPVKPMSGVQIAQVQRQFSPQVTVVTVGTPVAFPNFDTVRHHVYSFSPIKTFELKLYAGVPHAPVVFDKPGIAVLGCNIHDQMAAWVVVVDTPLHTRSAATGKAHIDGVSPGSYRLRVWHPSLAAAAEPTSIPLTVGTVDVEQHIYLNPVGPPK
jgi:plastocyanin